MIAQMSSSIVLDVRPRTGMDATGVLMANGSTCDGLVLIVSSGASVRAWA
jgi:hypothetical protein